MKVRIGGRSTGKTFKILKETSKNDGTLVVPNLQSKQYVQNMAKDLRIKCPLIITFDNIFNDVTHNSFSGNRNLYIDNSEYLMHYIFKGRFNIQEINIYSQEVDLLDIHNNTNSGLREPCSICKNMTGEPGSGFVANFCPICGRFLKGK